MNELPKGWAQTTISEVTMPYETTDPKKTPDEAFRYVDIGAIDNQTQLITEPKEFLGSKAPSRARRIIRSGDVLFSTVRIYLKNVAVVPESLDGQLTSTGIALLRPNAAMMTGYLFDWVRSDSFVTSISKSQDGTLYPAVRDSDVAKAGISVPPLAEQKRIVAKIGNLTTRISRAQTNLDHIPGLIEKYKQQFLRRAFSGELTEDWRKLHEVSESMSDLPSREIRKNNAVGPHHDFEPPYTIPESWRWYVLPELGDLGRRRSKHRPRNDPRLFGGKYPFIQTGDIRAAKQFLTEFSKTYNDFGLEQSRLWPVGTVCITIAANIAETAILNIQACFPDSVVGFLASENRVVPSYVEFFMRTVRERLSAFAPATAQKNINLRVLSSVRVPVPPLAEQIEIVRRIEYAFKWLDHVADSLSVASNLLPKLDSAILSKAFKGDLVLQDQNDEPASALLARIQAEKKAAQKPKRLRKPKVRKETMEMARKLEDVLAEAVDWLPAQEAFRRCGITEGAETETVEALYAELRELDAKGRLGVEPVADEVGRKLYDKLKLLEA